MKSCPGAFSVASLFLCSLQDAAKPLCFPNRSGCIAFDQDVKSFFVRYVRRVRGFNVCVQGRSGLIRGVAVGFNTSIRVVRLSCWGL